MNIGYLSKVLILDQILPIRYQSNSLINQKNKIKMSFNIRKLTPHSRSKLQKKSPTKSPTLLKKQPQSISPSTSENSQKSRQSIQLRQKISLQTIIAKKTTFVQQLNISSTSWCLFDEGENRYIGFREKNQREIASLTKIMTTLLCVELFRMWGVSQDFYVKVTDTATKMIGTTAQLKPFTWVKVWDLLYGTMLPSGNDAAFLLSEVVGYLLKLSPEQIKIMKSLDLSQQNTILYTTNFIRMMNRKAQDLNLKDTIFSNPHGLQNAMNMSTPKDILSLSQYASKDPHFRKIMNTDTTRYYYLEQNKEVPMCLTSDEIIQKHTKSQRRRWWNTNTLLNKGWQGIKTGQTGAAGSCLSSLKNGIYIVVLNCKDNEARFSQTQKIFDWYKDKKSRRHTEESEDSFS